MSDFDRIAPDYRDLTARSVAASGESPDFFAEYKVRDLAAHVATRGDAGIANLLDLGCGVGTGIRHLRHWFPGARVLGADPSRASVALAQAEAARPEDVQAFDGQALPHAEASLDVVYAACVLHHVDPPRRQALLGEVRRVLRPGGLLFVYEHNPWNPLTRRAVRSCPYDEGVVLLSRRELRRRIAAAGFIEEAAPYRVFFPHALAALRPLERWLRAVPLGAQYFVAARRPA